MTAQKLAVNESLCAADGRVLVLGHSHTNSLSLALAEVPSSPFHVVNINTLEGATLTRGCLLRLGKPAHVVSMVGGNAYYQVALLEHPQRLQVLGGPEDADIVPDRSLIPYGMMRDFLLQACRGHFQIIERIHETFALPLVHVISPPPLAAEDISDLLPPDYRDRGASGIVPPGLRLKVYRIQSAIVREFCESRSISVIEPPAIACDARGFLKHEYRSLTATHAGKDYGTLVLNQIMDRIDG